MIRAWDLPVRIVHWLLALSLAGAWISGGHARWLDLHYGLGVLAAALLAFRIVWGFIGSRSARWSTFWYAPQAVAGFLRALREGRAPRYLGHNPAAAWAMLVGLGLIAALTGSGFLVLGGEEQKGPLAGVLTIAQGVALHGVHEGLAVGFLVWLGVHLIGVAKEMLRTRENIVASMITGRKRAAGAVDAGLDVPPMSGAGAGLMLAVALGALGWSWDYLRATPDDPHLPFTGPELADDATWRTECGDCHLAYHPALLPARSWAAMMDSPEHFGEMLLYDEPTAARIRAFLVDNAAETLPHEAAFWTLRAIPAGEAPQRITETAYWQEVHQEIPDAVFETEAVRSRIRCQACHRDAEAGTFQDGAMWVPEEAAPVTEPERRL